MSKDEKIIEFLRREGPILPNKLARFLGSNLIIAGAYLSELSSRKIVLVSHLKVGGGSPIYYLPEHEEKLAIFYDELNGKDKNSFNLLKEKKVLRDRELDPLTRVSLRNIKDFAKPLEVNINGGKEIFWKWYLLKNEEAGVFIKELLKPKETPEDKPPAPQEEPKPEPQKAEEIKEELKKPEPAKELEVEKPRVEEIKKEELEEETVKEEPKPTAQEEKRKEKPRVEVKKEPNQETRGFWEKPQEKTKEIQSDFYEKVKNFLGLKNIKIVESEALRKTEINLVLKVPTAVGDIVYYAKAKSKKKCSDKDVSSAFLEGQIKKLPALFLYSGEMTKKTEEMLQQDIFKNLILLHLD